MIQGEYVCDRLVQVFRLIQQRLSMKGGNVLVEIGGEEIQVPGTRLNCIRVLLNSVMEILCGFGSQRPDLFVASSVAWYEQDRHTLDLSTVSLLSAILAGPTHHGVLINAPFSV